MSVLSAARDVSVEIIVVDNASSDGSREFFDGHFQSVKFIWETENHGFAKANNLALAMAKGELVLFLNPDTIIPEDGLSKCISFFQTQARCGALGVRMIDGAGNFLPESKRGFPPVAAALGRATQLKSGVRKSGRGGYYANHVGEHETAVIDVISGAFLMARRTLLEEGKGFDERYFMYAEDIDLSYSLQQAGSENYYFPNVTIIHFKGESQGARRVHHARFYGAMHEFVDKHYKKSLFQKRMIHVGVSLSHVLANAKAAIAAIGNTKVKAGSLDWPVYVVALQDRFNKIIQLLKHAQPPIVIAGRISPIENEPGPATASLASLPGVSARGNARFLFCQGPLSFKEIIELVDNSTKGQVCLFHAENGRSIIAASDKKSKSIIITAARD